MKITYRQNSDSQELKLKNFAFSENASVEFNPMCKGDGEDDDFSWAWLKTRVYRSIRLYGLQFIDLKCEI